MRDGITKLVTRVRVRIIVYHCLLNGDYLLLLYLTLRCLSLTAVTVAVSRRSCVCMRDRTSTAVCWVRVSVTRVDLTRWCLNKLCLTLRVDGWQTIARAEVNTTR